MADIQHTPHPWIEERKKADPQVKRDESLRTNERLALFLTNKFGTMGMFYFLITWMFGWMILSVAGFWLFRGDPYPFTFLLFLSNLVQLFSLPILAVGQQILSRASEKQAEQTYKDAEAILKLQDEIHRLIKINNALTEEIHAAMLEKKKQ